MGEGVELEPGDATIPSLDGSYRIPALVNLPSSSPSEPSPAVVITHGIFTNMYEKGRFDRLAERVNNAGYTAVRFNFSGHGTRALPADQFSSSRAAEDVR